MRKGGEQKEEKRSKTNKDEEKVKGKKSTTVCYITNPHV